MAQPPRRGTGGRPTAAAAEARSRRWPRRPGATGTDAAGSEARQIALRGQVEVGVAHRRQRERARPNRERPGSGTSWSRRCGPRSRRPAPRPCRCTPARPAASRISGAGQSAVFPSPVSDSSTATPSPTRAAAGVTRRSSLSPEPIAPLNPAGRPLVRERAAPRGCRPGWSSAKRSSWLKNWRATGVLYLRVARGIGTVPGSSGKTTWCATKRSYHRPPMLRVAAMPDGRGLGIAPHAVDHRWLQRRRTAELEPQVAGEPGGGDDVHLLAHADGVGRDDEIHAPPDPAAGGRACSSSRLSRGLKVEAVAARLAVTSTTIAAASTVSLPCTARAGPICQRPGRTARSRTSSTVVRVGSAPSETSERSLRETISRPLNGGDAHLHRQRRVAHRAQGVEQLFAHRDAVLVHRGIERGTAALHQRDRRAASAITSPSLRRPTPA